LNAEALLLDPIVDCARVAWVVLLAAAKAVLNAVDIVLDRLLDDVQFENNNECKGGSIDG
jgi:hypothetical protein